MARYSEHDTSKIYQAADSFRANCLLSDGSLLFSDASVWRPDVLERIHKAFVATPDEGDRTFIDKFKDQSRQSRTRCVPTCCRDLERVLPVPIQCRRGAQAPGRE